MNERLRFGQAVVPFGSTMYFFGEVGRMVTHSAGDLSLPYIDAGIKSILMELVFGLVVAVGTLSLINNSEISPVAAMAGAVVLERILVASGARLIDSAI